MQEHVGVDVGHILRDDVGRQPDTAGHEDQAPAGCVPGIQDAIRIGTQLGIVGGNSQRSQRRASFKGLGIDAGRTGGQLHGLQVFQIPERTAGKGQRLAGNLIAIRVLLKGDAYQVLQRSQRLDRGDLVRDDQLGRARRVQQRIPVHVVQHAAHRPIHRVGRINIDRL